MKKETAIYPSHRKLLGTTLAAAIMTTLSCLLVIVQPHGKVGLVIGIVGAVFFGGCICILFIVLLKNFFRNRPTLLLTPDSLRIYVPAKGIYITIEWQRIADFSVFRTYLPQKRFSEPIPHIVGNTLAPSVNESDQDMRRSMAGIYRLQTDFPNVIIHFHIHLFGSAVAQAPSEEGILEQNYERGHQPRKAIVGQGAD